MPLGGTLALAVELNNPASLVIVLSQFKTQDPKVMVDKYARSVTVLGYRLEVGK